jgi:VanZ family protein
MIRQNRIENIHPLLDAPLARWLAVVAWMALIFFLSAQSRLPSPDDPLINFLFKKTAHFAAFGLLAFLFWRALPRGRWVYAASWALTLLYALSDEYHQSFVALRQPSLRDVVIDACGALAALFIIWYINRPRTNDQGPSTTGQEP